MKFELFTKKFKPNSIDELILPKRIKEEFKDETIKGNYLFYGKWGVGKTTLAKILSKNYPTLFLNISDESSVDIIRTKITDWCSTTTIVDDPKYSTKIVILDEMDGASDQFYKALRGTIEKFSESGLVKFIGTCNYIHKIPEPILDRFIQINFDPLNSEEEKEQLIGYYKRVYLISKKIGIEFTKDGLIEFVNRNFPSMRSILNKLQSFYIKGIKKIDINSIKILNYNFSDIFELILNKDFKPYESYKLVVSQYSTKIDDILFSLGNEFPEYIREHKSEFIDKLPWIIIKIAHYQSQRNLVIDPLISLLACIMELNLIIYGK